MNKSKYFSIGFVLIGLALSIYCTSIVPIIFGLIGGTLLWVVSHKPKPRIRRLGIMGGTFSPPHIGHFMSAEWTREYYDLNLVLFMVSANPPHKQGGDVLDASLRLEMVEAGVTPNRYFQACDLEMRREGKSYMVDTLRELRRQYGADVELFLMVGSEYLDPSQDWPLNKWHQADEIFKMATILVFPRMTEDTECRAQALAEVEEWIKLIPQARIEFLKECPIPAISSTLVRTRRRAHQSIWYLVTTEVWRVIRDRGHYLDPNEPKERRPLLTSALLTLASIGRELKAFWNTVRHSLR